jgi:hypothetical protein
MFYAKGVNCCAELRALLDAGPDGGSCPPVGACRGFEGTCGQITAQFESLSILPDYPDGLADYICHAFPDDDAPVDSFIVRRRRSVRLPRHGLRLTRAARATGWPHLHRQCAPCRAGFVMPPCASGAYASSACRLAVALPVTLFLQNAFAIANDSEAPEVRGSEHLHACRDARQPG